MLVLVSNAAATEKKINNFLYVVAHLFVRKNASARANSHSEHHEERNGLVGWQRWNSRNARVDGFCILYKICSWSRFLKVVKTNLAQTLAKKRRCDTKLIVSLVL